jgi:hypothetical protein
MVTRAEAQAKIRADLDWRGPNDKAMRHVVLTREQAEALLDPVDPLAVIDEIMRLATLPNLELWVLRKKENKP